MVVVASDPLRTATTLAPAVASATVVAALVMFALRVPIVHVEEHTLSKTLTEWPQPQPRNPVLLRILLHGISDCEGLRC